MESKNGFTIVLLATFYIKGSTGRYSVLAHLPHVNVEMSHLFTMHVPSEAHGSCPGCEQWTDNLCLLASKVHIHGHVQVVI